MPKILLIILIILVLVVSFVFVKKQENRQKQAVTTSVNIMKILSPVFTNNQAIPIKYSCDGANVNPPLTFSEIPANTKSLALIVDDPDAPVGTFTHWLMWNIDPKTAEVKENSVPGGAIQGKNSAGTNNWISPCPPSGQHRYYFKVYALDTSLNLASGSDRQALENAMKGHIVATGELMGVYKRE